MQTIALERSNPTREPLVAAAMLVIALLATGWMFRDTVGAMVDVWNTESFAHGWVIPVIAAWLAWTRREELRRKAIRPFWPALIGLVGCGLVWLLGRLASVNAVEQFALVGMVPCLVALIYGRAIAWTIAFPLAFLFFAVPFGQFLQPPMMEMTADFTVKAVQLSGVPIVREGLHFELPTGRWSVVEACSGLRYLLAAFPLACVYAYLSYRSWLVRALFVATVVAVAIVANWVRAYLIVMIGHLSDMELAVGVDHLIYGWVFFGIVMGLSFWVGSFWQDMPAGESPGESPSTKDGELSRSERTVAHGTGAAAIVLAGAVGLLASATWPMLPQALQSRSEQTVSLEPLAASVASVAAPIGQDTYRPMYDGGIARLFGLAKADPEVGVQVVHYLRQNDHGEMITWANRVVPAGPEDLTWRIVSRRTIDPADAGSSFPASHVSEYVVVGPSGRFLVWEWFWVNGRVLTDPRKVKVFTALDLVSGKGDESLAWFLWTPVATDAQSARSRLARVAVDLSGAARLAHAQ